MANGLSSDHYYFRTLFAYICYNLNFGFTEEGKSDSKEVDVTSSTLVAVKNIGGHCSSTLECHQFDVNTICVNAICSCVEGFSFQIDKCINASEVITETNQDDNQKSNINSHVLPLMIALGIMFVGMCVALNLFSRARFRNSRSIFNSPHPRLMNIKLTSGSMGKNKRKRRQGSRSGTRRPGSSSPPPLSPQSLTTPLNANELSESCAVTIDGDEATKKLQEAADSEHD